MDAKKILMRAARKQSHKKEIQKMSQEEAMELLRKLTTKEEPKNESQPHNHHGSSDP